MNSSRTNAKSVTAAAGLTAAAALILPTLPASASPQAHTDSIRYVSVKSCEIHGSTLPCGPWRLEMHSGKEHELTDARTQPLDASGKPVKDLTAPISVSGNGRDVAYFRKSDNRLVVRELGGAVHVMSEDALPEKIGMDSVSLQLSLDGRRLAVQYNDENGHEPSRVYEVAKGRAPAKIPGRYDVRNFSRDGSTVLVVDYTDDNTSRLLTYDSDGGELSRIAPPQVVANNAPYGLSTDRKTIAFFTGIAPKLSLRLYDTSADMIVQSTKVRPGGTDSPEAVDWTGDDEITVHISHTDKAGRTTMRILLIDPETGAVKVRDSYTVKSDAYFYAACGA